MQKKNRSIFFILILVAIATLTTFVYHKTQQSDINYYKGRKLFSRGQYQKAAAFYRKSLSISPERQDALTDLAYCYQRSDNFKDAIENFKKVLFIDPENTDIKIVLAETYSWNGESKKAIKLYEEILATNNDVDVKMRLAEVCIWDGNTDSAKEILEGVLNEHPGHAKARFLLAKAMHYSGEAEKAVVVYEELLEEPPAKELKNEEAREKELEGLIGEAYMISGDYDKAVKTYREILQKNPEDIKAKVGLADIFAYSKEFKKAIAIYEEILQQKEDLTTKRKLADVLSWDKQYKKAAELYDEILSEKEDASLRRQKARVLGWAREYSKSAKEYSKAYAISKDEKTGLEMRGKLAYWNSRIKAAISYYKSLIEKEPRNSEAMFDLSQIYSYQSMWRQAISEYKKILRLYPGHFRAREGLEKAELISKHLLSETGFEFFEADSSGRDNDIKRHSLFEELSFPVNDKLRLNARYSLGFMTFADFNDITENSARFSAEYRENPDWWADVFYNIFAYDKEIKAMHNFGAKLNSRVFDMGVSSLSYQRHRLENNSTVIRESYYADAFKERVYMDITKRLKIGVDYLFSSYSDGNFKNEPGFDVLYNLSLEPMKFSVIYRYLFREFDKKQTEYFSPKGFTTNRITLNWRHFLNKEEVFFGADDIYYDLKYDITLDSEDIVGHSLSGEFNWDITKRLNFNIKASATGSSTNVYNDRSLRVSLKYYF